MYGRDSWLLFMFIGLVIKGSKALLSLPGSILYIFNPVLVDILCTGFECISNDCVRYWFAFVESYEKFIFLSLGIFMKPKLALLTELLCDTIWSLVLLWNGRDLAIPSLISLRLLLRYDMCFLLLDVSLWRSIWSFFRLVVAVLFGSMLPSSYPLLMNE